jgi:hypothetical protein
MLCHVLLYARTCSFSDRQRGRVNEISDHDRHLGCPLTFRDAAIGAIFQQISVLLALFFGKTLLASRTSLIVSI